MSGQQAHAQDREAGERDVDQAEQPRDPAQGEDRAGEHPRAGAGGPRQQAVEADEPSRDGEEVSYQQGTQGRQVLIAKLRVSDHLIFYDGAGAN